MLMINYSLKILQTYIEVVCYKIFLLPKASFFQINIEYLESSLCPVLYSYAVLRIVNSHVYGILYEFKGFHYIKISKAIYSKKKK